VISVRPDSEGRRALGFIVAQPGKLDAAALGQLLHRPKLTGPGDYLAVRRAILAQGTPPPRTSSLPLPPLPRVPIERRPWSTDAAALLHGLQKHALIERCRPPMVTEEWADLAEHDAAEVIALAAHDVLAPDVTGLRAALLRELVRRTPATMGEWVGAGPSGHIQRAVADLVEWAVVCPPSFRWPTEAGVALVSRVAA
jgi:hypothetical protein